VIKSPLVILAAGALLALGVGQAAGATHRAQTVKTVTVVMHDPGCHWFSAAGTFKTKLTVHGPVALANLDDASLMVMGPKGMVLDKVGKKVMLARGTYRITMVGQAPDDNHLKLVVT
jgi:hypothetical protein